MKRNLSDEVLKALRESGRGPGWNNRSANVRRFEIGCYGLQCTLYVVPFRRWAYRRDQHAERQAQA